MPVLKFGGYIEGAWTNVNTIALLTTDLLERALDMTLCGYQTFSFDYLPPTFESAPHLSGPNMTEYLVLSWNDACKEMKIINSINDVHLGHLHNSLKGTVIVFWCNSVYKMTNPLNNK